jgi:hypothetical protein
MRRHPGVRDLSSCVLSAGTGVHSGRAQPLVCRGLRVAGDVAPCTRIRRRILGRRRPANHQLRHVRRRARCRKASEGGTGPGRSLRSEPANPCQAQVRSLASVPSGRWSRRSAGGGTHLLHAGARRRARPVPARLPARRRPAVRPGGTPHRSRGQGDPARRLRGWKGCHGVAAAEGVG